jgi:hypothetical protein
MRHGVATLVPRAAAREIVLLGRRGLGRDAFFAELAPRLRRVIDNDASCWHTLDPHTRLLTSDAPHELIERGVYTPDTARAAGELLVRSKYLVPDANTFASLAARRVPVGILHHATRGRPGRSARYRDLLDPSGIPHELRAAFVIRGRVWGAVQSRAARAAARSDNAMPTPWRMSPARSPMAPGRRCASTRHDAPPAVDAPGLIVVDPRDGVELITPPARELLDELGSDAVA